MPTLALGQGSRSIQFADSADRKVWSAAAVTDAPNPASLLSTKDPAVTLVPLSGDTVLCVLDVKSGNLATHPLSDSAPWKVSAADFKLIGQMTVRVQQGGKPIESASVSLNKSTAKLLDASSKGEVSFYGVSPGHVRVDVSYKSGGQDKTLNQQTDFALVRSDVVPSMICDVGGTTVTTPPVPAPTPGSKMPPPVVTPMPMGAGIVGSLVLIAVVAAIALGVLLLGLKWIYANQEKTKDALARVGVTVPDPIAADPDPVAPPPFVSAPVQSQIVLPRADPQAAPHPPTPSPQADLGRGGARIVGPLGAFDLAEGVNVVGREAGLNISLSGESTVSRRHAEIVRQGSQLTVRDGGSTNGTFVNGQRVAGEMPLHVGDSVQFGSVAFRVEG